jgi:hypothetical protein
VKQITHVTKHSFLCSWDHPTIFTFHMATDIIPLKWSQTVILHTGRCLAKAFTYPTIQWNCWQLRWGRKRGNRWPWRKMRDSSKKNKWVGGALCWVKMIWAISLYGYTRISPLEQSHINTDNPVTLNIPKVKQGNYKEAGKKRMAARGRSQNTRVFSI